MVKYHISDYIGKRYGHLTVVGQSEDSTKLNLFDFRCDCENTISETPSRVIKGHKSTCGKCYLCKNPDYSLPEVQSTMIGKKYNMLTVKSFAEKDNNWYAVCACECGNEKLYLPTQLKRLCIKSCGCVKNPKPKPPKIRKVKPYKRDMRSRHPLYGVWWQMIQRCENPKVNHYDRYGGRGIKVCKEWHNFWSFAKWSDSIGGRPKGFTIDRINNDGNYEPSNCRWASWETQTRNKASNRMIEYMGVSKPLVDWAKQFNISPQTISRRINRGYSIEKALTTKSFVGNNQYTKVNN